MFGITGRIWSALATVIKLETLLEVVLHASEFKRIK